MGHNFKSRDSMFIYKKIKRSGANNTPSPIDYKDIYKTLWKCRDFELSKFWQRAILLGSFMLAAYAGYGSLCVKLFDKGITPDLWKPFHLFALGIACFGLIISALWILMAKGSKGWIERCEAALTDFQKNTPRKVFVDKKVRKLSAFGAHWQNGMFENIEEANDSLLSSQWGRFSVSKVTICLGQISFLGWLSLAVIHCLMLKLDFGKSKDFFQKNVYAIAIVMVALCLTVVFGWLRKQTQSSSL